MALNAPQGLTNAHVVRPTKKGAKKAADVTTADVSTETEPEATPVKKAATKTTAKKAAGKG